MTSRQIDRGEANATAGFHKTAGFNKTAVFNRLNAYTGIRLQILDFIACILILHFSF